MGCRLNRTLCFLLLVFAAFITRLLPHAPNWTAVGALALWSGTWFQSGQGVQGRILHLAAAISVPFAVLLASDLILGFHDTMFFVYVGFAAVALFGTFLQPEKSGWRALGGSVVASTLFFVISNFGVWFSGLYPQNMEGLIKCYVMAIPFFGNQLASDLIFNAVFATAIVYVGSRKVRAAAVARSAST